MNSADGRRLQVSVVCLRPEQTFRRVLRLRGYQRALEGGHRIARVSAAGDKEILGDAQRASELERTRAQIEQNCR